MAPQQAEVGFVPRDLAFVDDFGLPALAAWFVVRELAAPRWRESLESIRLIVEIVLVLQIPYIIDRISSDTPRGAPTMIAEGVVALIGNPGSAHPAVSFDAVVARIAYLWSLPFAASSLPWLLASAALGILWASRRRPDLACVTLVPFLIAVVGFAAWTRPMEVYWFMGLAPSLAVMIAGAVCAGTPGRARDVAALLVLAVVLYAQPSRLNATLGIHRLPEYGPLIEGTRAIARHTKEIGAIVTEFALPPSTPASFPFTCMGGRLSRSSSLEAVIAGDGSVVFRERK